MFAYHALQVIARNSSFAYKRQDKPAQEIGAALNVQNLVEGSVRKSGNRVRITARLADVATGAEIWSQRYDREFEDIFAVQDEATESVVAILPERLQAADLARAKRKNTSNMAAHDYLLHGIDHYYKETREDNARAVDYLEKSTSRLIRVMPRPLPGSLAYWDKENTGGLRRRYRRSGPGVDKSSERPG